MRVWELITLIVRVAFRNLWLYRLKTVVIATLLGMGSFLAIVGLSLLNDIENSMKDSIVSSVVGHLQIYSGKAKDDLAIFGSGFMGRTDIGTMPNFVTYRDVVMKDPNVEAFVPMGSDMALLSRGNEIDETLEAFRNGLKSGDKALIEDRKQQLAFQLRQIEKELEQQGKLTADLDALKAKQADLQKALDPNFLGTLNSLDEEKLLFLDTQIAPLSGEKQPIYLNYLGTDISLFEKNFRKFKVVEGEPLPPGKRGILLSYKVRETYLKNLVARIFDDLKKRVTVVGVPIKGDPENERSVANLGRQYTQITGHLDSKEAEDLSKGLEAIGIKSDKPELIEKLKEQLKGFLTVDDSNLALRMDWFYANIAPKIRLYEISPGETVIVRSYTRSGYIKSLPLKVYGVYSFQGLEDSDLAGTMNITDLVSFRELYGEMTEESKKELEDLRKSSDTVVMAASNAEDALFGESSQAQLETRNLEKSPETVRGTIQVKPVIPDTFDVSEVESGLALNAAIRLKDGSKLEETQENLKKAMKDAGLDVKIVTWQDASGFVGQFANIVRMVLVFALGVIFVVALVIINNSIIVGTLNRTREIGTMRAIGAQKTFVVGLFLAETAITALIGALIGTVLATALLLLLGHSGIPAQNGLIAFLFSGPRLFPTMRANLIVQAPIIIALIATVASIYAARHAAHVQPAEAMQEKE